MAVLPGVPRVSVNVRVAGEIATEYEAPGDQAPVVRANSELSGPVTHCYIEAKTGAEFGIEMTVNSDFPFPRNKNAISMHVYIDGIWMRHMFLRDYFKPSEETRSITAIDTLCPTGQEGGECSFKNFMFSPIVTSETNSSEDIATEIVRAKNLGVIKVVLMAGTTGEITTLSPSDGLQIQGRELPEKALKGRELSHRVALAASTKSPNQPATRILNQEQLGTIFFHYRSHEALRREMIIPRSPSPETQPLAASSPVEADLSNLSEDEIRRLAGERLRDLQVKNESGRVKREAGSPPRTIRPLKMIKLDDGTEAFDLTEDD